MDFLNIKLAFEKELTSLNSDIESSYENVEYEPKDGVPYQILKILPDDVENPTYGDNYYREVGEFLVLLCYPSREGSSKALQKAHVIRDAFFRGRTLVEGGTKVTIDSTPRISGATVADDRYIVPVTITYFSSILK